MSDEYHPRTPGRLIEILNAQSENPRSWQREAAAEIARLTERNAEHEHRYDALEARCIVHEQDWRRERARAEAAEAERDRLREALKPFVEQIELIECTSNHDYSDAATWPLDDCAAIKISDMRLARAVYQQLGDGKDG